jgi:ribonucleoside-diphosphate reductase alpha chain
MSTLPVLSENALTVLRERYLRRDGWRRPIEDPAAMLRRVASTIAEPARSFGEDAALWEARFLERLERIEFLPNSPTLMNAGLTGGQLAACFVLCTKRPAAIAARARNNPYNS